jgi:hypothetical protein
LLTRVNTVDGGLTERVFRGSSILIEQFLYLLPLLVDLHGEFKVFKGFDALPDVVAGIFNNGIIPND